jgi:hypothetical protein
VVVDERTVLLETLSNKGVPKSKTGIRLYNQKYFSVRFDEANHRLYLKKVKYFNNIGKRRSLYCEDQ